MRLQYIFLCVLLLGIFSLPAGCGKKAPPSLTKTKDKVSLQVEGLKALKVGDQIQLTGRVTVSEGHRLSPTDVSTCRVFHVRYPVDSPPCEGCPIPFTVYKELRPDLAGNEGFVCDTGQKKNAGIHYFMVQLVDMEGRAGPPSNTAKLLVK